MGLFSKKNKSTGGAEVQEQVAAKPAKKKKDTLAGVIHETVPETIMDIVAKNDKFKLQRNGETVYAGMLLSVEDIGGLSKKTKNDESKGSIVEYINNGTLTVLATGKLLEDEKLVFIPTPSVLHGMTEFTILCNAPYELCYIHSDGGVELTGKKITREDMCSVVNDVTTIRALAGESVIDEVQQSADEPASISEQASNSESEPVSDEPDDTDDDFDVPDEPVDDVNNNTSVDYIDYDDGGGFDDFDDIEDNPDENEDNLDENENYDNGGYSDEEYDEDNFDDGDYDDYDDDAEITEEEVKEIYVRKFYSADLGLEVSTEPFDAMFQYGNAYVPFEENRPDSWINKQLNEMSAAANIDIKRIHENYIRDARNLYINLMSKTCEIIENKYDIHDAATAHGQQYEKILNARKDAKRDITDVVSKHVEKIKNEYDKNKQEHMNVASMNAGHKYDEMHRAAYQAAINNARREAEDEVDKHFNEEIRKLEASASDEARKELDYAITAVIKEVTDVYALNFELEKEAIKAHEKAIKDYIDEHRKNDIAHDKLRQDELDERKKSDEVTKNYEARIKEMQAEFEAKQRQLDGENKSRIENTEERMRSYKQDCDKQVADANKKSADLQAQLDNMLDRYAKMDETKKIEYNARISELQNERDAMTERCKHLEQTHTKSNIVGGFLVVAIAVASIAVGIILGTFLNFRGDDDNNQTAPVQQSQQQVVMTNAPVQEQQSTLPPTQNVISEETEKPVKTEEKVEKTERETKAKKETKKETKNEQ